MTAPLRRWLLLRALLLVPALLGITFVTFAVLDQAPLDRAAQEVAARVGAGDLAGTEAREVALVRLRVRYGLIDAETLEPVPLLRRYGRWLANVTTFRLAGPDEDQQTFRRRIADALPVSLLLGACALALALAIGIPLGAWLGMRAGTGADRAVSRGLFVLVAVPEFVLATLLLLALCGGWLRVFPPGGLRSDGAESWSAFARLADLAWHLALPVAVLATAPAVVIARFLRDAVARAARQPFALALRAWGTERAVLRRRLLRAGAVPLATLAGSLLPMLVGGSVVVEQAFALDGVGRLAWQSAMRQDQAMVMAVTLLGAVVTLLALAVSDLAHRLVDPRVRLAA